MGINFAPAVAPVRRSGLTRQSAPGIYISKRGSVLLKPDSNSKGNGKADSSGAIVILDDCDTHKTFVKCIDNLKGEYEFKGSLSNYNLSEKAPSGVGRRDL